MGKRMAAMMILGAIAWAGCGSSGDSSEAFAYDACVQALPKDQRTDVPVKPSGQGVKITRTGSDPDEFRITVRATYDNLFHTQVRKPYQCNAVRRPGGKWRTDVTAGDVCATHGDPNNILPTCRDAR